MSDSTDSHHPRPHNHLIEETSPYLLQHAHNPVDWYPWGPQALEKARKQDKPIFLSVGYAACHWCHVMEHESFEDEQIAAILNEKFVPIKVDREERPDLDQIYMNAVQMMTGRGGWPMSVFLTPDLQPFYGGTYYPPRDRMGMPGFERVLGAVAEAWQQKRDELVGQAGQITERIRAVGAGLKEQGDLTDALLDAAFHALDHSFDEAHGGFGAAPKFPHAMDLRLLLRYWFRTGSPRALQMVQTTLGHMAAGGIYDHLAGGFHRYSTDARWLVPHFEKMLYDNALLTVAYLEAHQATREPRYACVARETLDYVIGQMTDAGRGFYSTEDADSEGEEGKFYVWTMQEVDTVLGEELSRVFSYCYDVTEFGNWEGKTILNQPKTLAQAAKLLSVDEQRLEEQLVEARAKLREVRAQRVRPDRDEKVLTDWNALMIEAFALGGRVLNEPRYLDAAQAAAAFLLEKLRDERGRLLHCYKDGRARFAAYADDYAFLAGALITLYETTFDPRWFRAARELAEVLLDQFWDDIEGGLFFTAKDHEKLIARNKTAFDNATPSANSVAALALLRLAKLTGEDRWRQRAEQILSAFRAVMTRAPTGAAQMLIALDFYLSPVKELAVVGTKQEVEELLQAVYHRFLPNKVTAAALDGDSDAVPLLAGKATREGRATLYVCEDFTCAAPVAGTDVATAALDELLPEHVSKSRSLRP